MDALLMTLIQLEQGSTYNVLAKAFGCLGSKMRCLVTNVVTFCGEDVYKHFPANKSMLEYCARNIMLAKFPDCIKAINVTFQHGYQHRSSKPKQCIWYSRNMEHQGSRQKWRLGWTVKHNTHWNPTQVFTMNSKIFKDSIDKHLEQLVKNNGDQKEQDNMSVDAIEEQYQ